MLSFLFFSLSPFLCRSLTASVFAICWSQFVNRPFCVSIFLSSFLYQHYLVAVLVSVSWLLYLHCQILIVIFLPPVFVAISFSHSFSSRSFGSDSSPPFPPVSFCRHFLVAVLSSTFSRCYSSSMFYHRIFSPLFTHCLFSSSFLATLNFSLFLCHLLFLSRLFFSATSL